MQYTQHGWPDDKRKLYSPTAKFWGERGNLSVHDDLLLRGRQLEISPCLRKDILHHLHDGHQGITRTRENAASSVWLPGISRDIERMVRECPMCEKYRKERIEPMRGTEFPDRPWSKVGADFFQHEGKVYLLVVDYYSRDVEISTVSRHVNTIDTILKMKRDFSRHGIPDIVFSDNGPQFDSNEFHDFAADWEFQHITSSPKYPQSNGEVERAVQTMRMILKKSTDEYVTQLSVSRKLKTRVPCHPNELKPQLPDYELVKKKEKAYRDKMKADYDRRHRVVQPNGPFPGDRVWIQTSSERVWS